jgi:hypothetical protein
MVKKKLRNNNSYVGVQSSYLHPFVGIIYGNYNILVAKIMTRLFNGFDEIQSPFIKRLFRQNND